MKRNWTNKSLQCPRCGNRAVDEHPTQNAKVMWYFCRDCGLVWESKPKEEAE